MEDKEILIAFNNEKTRHSAFHELIKKYQERVYWHIRKMVISHEDADDLTQEVFIKVYNNLEKFQAEAQLFTWIYRIATNESLNFLRKKRKRFWVPIHDVEKDLSEKLKAELHTDGNEIEYKLQQALLQLPEKQRLVFNMKYFDELKYEQISEILGTSVGALKSSYHHAVKKLENLLKDE